MARLEVYGITLRDYLAAQAAGAYVSKSANEKGFLTSGLEFEEYVAAQAYMLADAMLAERMEP